MKFKNNGKIFFRAAAQGLENVDLVSWLKMPQTQLALRISYPDLFKKIQKYPSFDLEKSDLLPTLSGLRARMSLNTVPLGSMVLVGQSEKSQFDEDLNSKSNELFIFEKNIGQHDQKVAESQWIQKSPFVYIKTKKIYFLKRKKSLDIALYEWCWLPKNRIVVIFLAWLKSPKKKSAAKTWLQKKGLKETDAQKIIAILLSEGLIISNTHLDRFSMRKPLLLNKSNSNAGLDFVGVLKDLKNTDSQLDAVLVSKHTTSLKLRAYDESNLSLASMLISANSPKLANSRLDCFNLRQQFLKKFDTRAIPVLEFLDPLKGQDGAGPLIPTAAGSLHRIIADKYENSVRTREPIRLTRSEIGLILNERESSLKMLMGFSTSFFATETAERNDNRTFWIRKIFAGPAVRPMGRFFRFLNEIDSREFLPKLPDRFLWAEIGGAPQTKIRDLLECKIKHPHINIFNRVDPNADQISLEDLYLIERNGLLLPWSRSRNKFILPLQSNAVDRGMDQNPASILLTKIASQFGLVELRFHWNQLENQDWLPQIEMENIIISPERWSLSCSEFRKEAKLSGGKGLMDRFALNEKLQVFSENREPFLLLDQPLSLNQIDSMTTGRDYLKLQALPPIEKGIGVSCFGSKLATEFIVPYSKQEVTFKDSGNYGPGRFNFKNENVVSLAVFAGPLGQDEILGHIGKSLKKFKLPWFYLRPELSEIKIRALCESKSEAKKKAKLIEEILLKPAVAALYSTYSFNQYFAEKDVYSNPDWLKMYHLVSWADSLSSLKAISMSEKYSDSFILLAAAAWISCYEFSIFLGIEKFSVVCPPLDSDKREQFYKARDVAAKEIETNGVLWSIYNERTCQIKKEMASIGTRNLTEREKHFFYSRLVHLSLNRLSAQSLRHLEPRFLKQAPFLNLVSSQKGVV